MVALFAPDGSKLHWLSCLGGSGFEQGTDLALDPTGGVTVCGVTRSKDFPTTTGAFQQNPGGEYDAFVTKFTKDRSSLFFSSFLGGLDCEMATALDLDRDGTATVVGETLSPDFPVTKKAFQTPSPAGEITGFVTRLDLLPEGVRRRGSPDPLCGPPLSLHPSLMPKAGAEGFALGIGNAPSNRMGLVLPGNREAQWFLGGASFFLVPATVLPVFSEGSGHALVPLPLPPQAGLEFMVQVAWGSGSPRAFRTSPALKILTL